MNRSRATLATLVLALAGAAGSAHAVQLVRPSVRSVLQGGSFAAVEIAPGSVPLGTEEWEAFLSLDGGAHYDVRLTPHLDLAVQRFSWLVPNVDATDARILIRTGDERHETIEEIPITFSIRRDQHVPIAPQTWFSREQPEPARPGDEPVVFWTEGDRRGSVGAAATRLPNRDGWDSVATHALACFPAEGPSRAPLATRPLAVSLPLIVGTSPGRPTAGATGQLDILLVCRRRNI